MEGLLQDGAPTSRWSAHARYAIYFADMTARERSTCQISFDSAEHHRFMCSNCKFKCTAIQLGFSINLALWHHNWRPRFFYLANPHLCKLGFCLWSTPMTFVCSITATRSACAICRFSTGHPIASAFTTILTEFKGSLLNHAILCPKVQD